ncbi:MAG TPA: hypothetical protein VMF11_06505 [Candidatus Baltobacteraceae bacterium]|nr:hypothetical protein [Candidatus Baltobacteraceae bacterium]
MWRFTAGLLTCTLLLGAAQPAAKTSAFDILGASIDLAVDRDGTRLPATQVPFLKSGDGIEISFSKGVQFSRMPRWHLIVADMYENYLEHPPVFSIPDADLSRAKAGTVWKTVVPADATPLIFLVPESGSRYGHGIPDARAAIAELSNRALLLRTARLSASVQVKASTLRSFLGSLASIQPGELADGRARVAAASQSLFGSNLGGEACFNSTVAQSTQYACAAQAVAAGYESSPKPAVVAAVGSGLSVNTATYGMLIGTLYQLLAKRRVSAHYSFEPGVVKPGAKTTDVYVSEQLQYDPSAAKPSTIVYFTIGSRATSPKPPVYGPAPALPVCLADRALDLTIPFSALPIYFRSHEVRFKAGGASFAVPATYDVVRGYRADLSAQQFSELKSGGTASIVSNWGFESVQSPAIDIIEPHPVKWALQKAGTSLVAGAKSARLTFDDAGAGMGSCVQTVEVTDELGDTIALTKLERAKDTVTASLDASQAGGASGSAIVRELGNIESTPVAFTILPAMPSITSAIAYLPKGVLVLKGTGLKYIASVMLERTGIRFGSGTPDSDGSWSFTAQTPAGYNAAWEHETMAISFTLAPPDKRTAAVEADVEYAPTPAPSPTSTPTP